ncbi:hypothetical protein [Staphylospora marina]|uniref:hypothetical protein n=1 Tax=Staphylospora marina TaxID=2490858 RepID=UPI000F5BB42B|nr:hypothetical protein [Staphylospora marina]
MSDHRQSGPKRPHGRLHDDRPSLSIEDIRRWSGLVSKRAKQFDELLAAFESLSLAARNKEHITDIISALAGLNKKLSSGNQAAGKKSSPGASASGPTGDLLYDLFTSPNMRSVVSEVMKSKPKRW